MSPEELRSRQLAALVAWLLAGARTQPIVLAFEDLHWADPTSLDVLQALAERGAQAPLLIIATTRPEFRPPWKQRSHHGVISLAPLDAGEVARMVGEIATRHALSKDVIAGVSERSGGVPLFVEEVTRLLLERGEQGGVQAIPPTLQQSLAARLDRLGSAREIAQIGAVLGRGFSHALLQAVAGLDEPTLRAALDRLADAELLFVEGVAPQRALSLQACADPGRRLRQPAEEPPPDAAPARRRGPAGLARAGGRGARASFHASGPDRPRDQSLTFPRIASAGSLSGTRCSRAAFMRSAGIVQTLASTSISDQRAARISRIGPRQNRKFQAPGRDGLTLAELATKAGNVGIAWPRDGRAKGELV